MSVNSEDFLLAAEQLLNNGSHEIDYRNCMSRAYYASFHALSPLSNQLPAVANYQTKGSHDEKISKLTRCSSNQPEAKTLKAVGYEIHKRKAQREKPIIILMTPLLKAMLKNNCLKQNFCLNKLLI